MSQTSLRSLQNSNHQIGRFRFYSWKKGEIKCQTRKPQSSGFITHERPLKAQWIHACSAGRIMAVLEGIAVGGAVGCLAGALIVMGIPEYEANRYEGRIQKVGILL